MSADNQQETITIVKVRGSSETTRGTLSVENAKAYLQGALHDGTFNHYNERFRYCQVGTDWLNVLRDCLKIVGHHSWIYREGKTRNVFVLETMADFLDIAFNPLSLITKSEKIAYLRGFFDAEGGIPRSPSARFYIQLVQNNKEKLVKLKTLLNELEIITGVIHNPSKAVDPDYFRMFVLKESQVKFVGTIGSWHSRKLKALYQRKEDDIVHALWRHGE